jgi:hypothetical protein
MGGPYPPAQSSKRADWKERADKRRAKHPLRVIRGQQECALRTLRERREHYSLGMGSIHHRERVGCELLL